MNYAVIIGLFLFALLFFAIVKLALGFFSETRLLKYEFPTGWRDKIQERYKLYRTLSPEQKVSLEKKLQILVGKNQLNGLESMDIHIDMRLAVAFEMSLLNLNKSSAKLYRKVSPISLLPMEAYEKFKNRSSHTLYWSDDEKSLYLETPDNELLKSSYYLWLRVDKRFSHFSDRQLKDLHVLLSEGKWPNEDHFTQLLGENCLT